MMRTGQLPYWLEGGTETCDLCTVVHVLQMQLRCVACDRGCCEQCFVVVHATREVLCTECHEAAAAEEADDRAPRNASASSNRAALRRERGGD